jgi:hypothetical protein
MQTFKMIKGIDNRIEIVVLPPWLATDRTLSQWGICFGSVYDHV